MAAHKYWQARLMTSPTPDSLELSEFHLYNGTTRVDASATLSANTAPTGAVSNMKDDNTSTGSLWSTGGASVVLTWTFGTATNVDSIVVGARTTIARFPTSLILVGGDDDPMGTGAIYTEFQFYGGWRFTSAAKTSRITPTSAYPSATLFTAFDHLTPGGTGRVPYDVKREVLPSTTPKTYVPMWAKVRLERDIDGKVIREQWSDKITGAGSFEGVDPNYTYTVTAIDPAGGLRAVIADRIKPEGYPT